MVTPPLVGVRGGVPVDAVGCDGCGESVAVDDGVVSSAQEGTVAEVTRISDDRRGAEAGVTRQREDCLALVADRGWTFVRDRAAEVLSDNDISAYSGKTRPAHLRLLEAISEGRVDVVVAWHPDRLYRSPRQLEDFITLLERTGTTVHTKQSGRYDPVDALGSDDGSGGACGRAGGVGAQVGPDQPGDGAGAAAPHGHRRSAATMARTPGRWSRRRRRSSGRRLAGSWAGSRCSGW